MVWLVKPFVHFNSKLTGIGGLQVVCSASNLVNYKWLGLRLDLETHCDCIAI